MIYQKKVQLQVAGVYLYRIIIAWKIREGEGRGNLGPCKTRNTE